MTLDQKTFEFKHKMFELISTNEITLLHNLDKQIVINKNGKFNYYKFF
jgi:hypothetical protein